MNVRLTVEDDKVVSNVVGRLEGAVYVRSPGEMDIDKKGEEGMTTYWWWIHTYAAGIRSRGEMDIGKIKPEIRVSVKQGRVQMLVSNGVVVLTLEHA